jgi:hypothetical protein
MQNSWQISSSALIFYDPLISTSDSVIRLLVDDGGDITEWFSWSGWEETQNFSHETRCSNAGPN